MRIKLSCCLIVCCLLPACASPIGPGTGDAQPARFADTDGDGLPDQRDPAGTFVDNDGDGLPDRVEPRSR